MGDHIEYARSGVLGEKSTQTPASIAVGELRDDAPCAAQSDDCETDLSSWRSATAE